MAHLDRSTAPIRQERFTLSNDAPSHRFARAQEYFSFYVELERPAGNSLASTEPFRADVAAYNLGKSHFLSAQMGARIVRHTENHAYSHSPDHWTVEYVKRGNIVSRSGDRAMQASDGSLILRSLAHPYVATSDDTDTMAVHLDRDSFPKLADWLDRANHTQITGTFGALFKDFMLSLEAHLPTFTLADIPVINASLAALVRSLVLGSPQYSLNEHPLIEAAMFNRARNYIEANIRSPHLSPDTTARALGMSSRKLYYLFEKRGGVANYIRHRRLAACHRALTDISEFRSIREIAEQFGLGNRSLFNRQFRGRYGYGPSEAREATLLGYASNPSVPKFLWVD